MSRVSDLPVQCRDTKTKPTFEKTRTGVRASDAWIVPFDKLNDFLVVVEGIPETIIGITRIVSLRFAEYDWALAMAYRCEWIGYGATGFWGARVHIQYESPPWGDDFLTVNTSPDSRTLRKPASTLLGIAEEPVGGTVYSLTYHDLAAVPLNDWRSIGGTINLTDWRGFPAKTVWFGGPQTSQSYAVGGTVKYRATLQFRASRLEWNKQYAADGTLVDTSVPPAVEFSDFFGS